jgi:hypothetical protein
MDTQLNHATNGHGLGHSHGALGAPAVKGPAKIAYSVVDRQGKSYWTRIGAAFTNRDGSLTIRLDAIPVSGTLQLRDWTPRDAGERHDEPPRGSDPFGSGFGAPPTDIPF